LEAIIKLRNENLLAKESRHRPNTLDCHPLIREHFGEKLENENPDAWKEAHARLYEYYKNLPKKESPDTLEEMEPLFAAVRHGCLAGKHQETLVDVFYIRISRFGEAYSVLRLDVFSAHLSCLSNFFERLWDRPVSGLTDHYKILVLLWAGNVLHAMGRLLDASHLIKAGLEMQITKKDWINAASFAFRLSELYLTIGQLASAVAYGRQSVEFADKSLDGFWMEAGRTIHADALHQAGNVVEAEKLFHEAEQMQHKRLPEDPYLLSLRGFRYCNLLLSMGKYKEVQKRAKMTLEWVKRQKWVLEIALDNLTIGMALIYLNDYNGAENYLNQAVDGLRQAGQQQYLPPGLYARATYFQLSKDFPSSWVNLDEALEIAEYGQMGLHLTDYHLEAARLIRAQLSEENTALSNYQIIENGETLVLTRTEMQAKCREHFIKAEELINKTGYHRRDKELEELRKNV
jgi:tetratricopeptide (TPR) repeat protein